MKYATITPTELRACLDTRMTVRQIAEQHNLPLHCVRAACTLFGWKATVRRPKLGKYKPRATQGAHNPFGVAA